MTKFLLRITVVFTSLLFLVNKGQAQNLNNSRINQFSDQQVMQLWQQAAESGLSETDAMKLLVKKGLKPNEVSQFKKRLVGLQTTKKSQFSKSSLIQDTSGFMRDSTWVLEVPELKKISNRYGYNFFSSPNISFEPNLRIATPKTYVVGPDDQLNVTLTGLNETEVMARVNPDGDINIPYVGLVAINGLTIEQARERIFSKMAKAYPCLLYTSPSPRD